MAKKELTLEEQQLEALVGVPGALKIITNEPSGADYPATDPRHFVQHDVTAIEGPDERGRYVARSDEGDFTIGQPGALLARLQQWRGVR